MKKENVDKLQMGLIVFAMLVLIVMNVFTFTPVMLGVLRALLAISMLASYTIFWATRKLTVQKIEL